MVDSTSEVESLVADMVKEKLKVTIPDLEINNSSASFKSCDSEIIRSVHMVESDVNIQNPVSENDDFSEQNVDEQSSKQSSSNVKMEVIEAVSGDNFDMNAVDDDVEQMEAENPIVTRISTPEEESDSMKIEESEINGITQSFLSVEKETNDSFMSLEMLEKEEKKCSNMDTEIIHPRKVSAFGCQGSPRKGSLQSIHSPENLAAHGEGRRQVLTTIFTKGQRSTNMIARGVAPAARRAIQAMDRRRAQRMMNAKLGEDKNTVLNEDHNFSREGWTDFDPLQDPTSNNTLNLSKPSEEDECVEAIRLLLVQNSVALGKISPEKAVQAMNLHYTNTVKKDNKKNPSIDEMDAGKIDSRLAGCGTVSSAVFSALELWKKGLVSHAELLDLVQKDLQYNRLTLPGAENESKLKEDSVFWGRFAFGERWAEKKARIQASSVFGAQSGWDITGVIVKSNDDLRQEAFAMQLIELCSEAFKISGLELWTYPYRILATGRTTGIIEMVQNSMSFDSLKKRPGYEEGGLVGHFKKMTEYAANPTEALKSAKKNFVRSLAAYSLLSYFFVFKDRHNGNILLDTAGHVIHIDFGFIFGIAPGGSFSLESSVPFKLTEEMILVMDGLGSVLFSEFVTLFCCGFLALQAHCETFVTIVEITCEGSTFNCFEGKETTEITSKLRERFCPDLNKEETISHAMDLIRQSCNATGTKQYDFFQYMSQGIAA